MGERREGGIERATPGRCFMLGHIENMDTDTLRAWAAGFVDAKAYISVGPGTPRIIIKQKDSLALECLERHFDGNGRLQRDGIHAWRICGDAAREFAQTILPYMLVKVEEMEQIATQPLTGLHYKRRHKSTFSPPYRSFDEREERSHLARRLRAEGHTLTYIGKQLNVSRQRVRQILTEF